MKQIIRITFIMLTIFMVSSSVHAQKKVFLKEFEFKLVKVSDIPYENEYFITFTFNKNSLYQFDIMNNVGDFFGDAVVEIYDGDKVVATNILGEKYYENFVFKCTKTGYYDIIIKFKDNGVGSSIVKLFLVS